MKFWQKFEFIVNVPTPKESFFLEYKHGNLFAREELYHGPLSYHNFGYGVVPTFIIYVQVGLWKDLWYCNITNHLLNQTTKK